MSCINPLSFALLSISSFSLLTYSEPFACSIMPFLFRFGSVVALSCGFFSSASTSAFSFCSLSISWFCCAITSCNDSILFSSLSCTSNAQLSLASNALIFFRASFSFSFRSFTAVSLFLRFTFFSIHFTYISGITNLRTFCAANVLPAVVD